MALANVNPDVAAQILAAHMDTLAQVFHEYMSIYLQDRNNTNVMRRSTDTQGQQDKSNVEFTNKATSDSISGVDTSAISLRDSPGSGSDQLVRVSH